MNLEDHIEDFIKANQMFVAGDHVLISVSGGPDSVALLSLLDLLSNKWCLTLRVVHFDHGLRGMESEADALFVTRLCQKLSIPCVVKQLNLNSFDRFPHGSSLQEYARDIRYQELARMASETGANKIAVGHTADDQAETIIMWMVRGAGTGGLCGIPPVRDSHIIRPLLNTNRIELLSYLKRRELTYRIDSSNDSPTYWRNRVRQEVMPILKRYNPNLSKAIVRQADIVREEDTYLTQLAGETLEQIQESKTNNCTTLCCTPLLNLPLALRRRVVRMAIQEMSKMSQMPRFDAIETILNQIVIGQSGSWVELHGVSIVREYEYIHFYSSQDSHIPSRPSEETCQTVAIPSQVVWALTGQTMYISTRSSSMYGAMNNLNRYQARLDADAFSPSLVLRNWKVGDQFHPLGMGGKRKKLQDFFSDIKLERSQRHRVPLLVAPEGIIWIGGYRLDHRFRVTESTQTFLVASLSEETRAV